MFNRKQIIMSVVVSVFLLSCGSKSASVSSQNKEVKAIVSNIRGSAFVIRSDAKKAAIPGLQLQPSDVIETTANTTMDLAIKGFGVVKIGANTRIVVLELVAGQDSDKATLAIDRGDVASFIDRQNPDSEFKIRTPTAVAGVRGTSFIVSVDAKKSSFAVMEGSVSVRVSESDHNEVIIEKNSQLVIEGQNRISKALVQPLSKGSLQKIKRLSVFHKSNVLEFNNLISKLQKSSAELTFLEGNSNVDAELEKRDQRDAKMTKDSVARVKRADISKTLKRDTKNDPIKLQADKSYDK